jgi:hypothetical protein
MEHHVKISGGGVFLCCLFSEYVCLKEFVMNIGKICYIYSFHLYLNRVVIYVLDSLYLSFLL